MDRQWGSLGSALDFEYDAAGNTREKPLSSTSEFRYTHDAWNRLVKVEQVVSGTPTTITEQAFNGLHWRTVLKQDTSQVRNGLDQVRRQYYDAPWRLVYESVDDGWSSGFTEDRVVEQFWGLRYIDDAVLRRTMSTAAEEPFTRHHTLTDVQFSVVAVMASNGGVVERLRYTPYGQAGHFWGDDVNGDLQTDFFDFLDLQSQMSEPEPYIGGDDYRVEMDLDRDGDIDGDDWNLIGGGKSALPAGWISNAGSTTLDNTVGYDGYLFLPATAQYHVRARTYDPELGRWLERDPELYVDGNSLYQYVRSTPIGTRDPSGRAACCGLDVTDRLNKLLQRVDSRLSSLPIGELRKTCTSMLAWRETVPSSSGWDIEQFFRRAYTDSFVSGQCGLTPECKRTVTFNGSCYLMSDINYVLFGVAARRCFERGADFDSSIWGVEIAFTEDAVIGMVTSYRSIWTVLGWATPPGWIAQALSPSFRRDVRPAGMRGRVSWTVDGYNAAGPFGSRVVEATDSDAKASQVKRCKPCMKKYTGWLTGRVGQGGGRREVVVGN